MFFDKHVHNFVRTKQITELKINSPLFMPTEDNNFGDVNDDDDLVMPMM